MKNFLHWRHFIIIIIIIINFIHVMNLVSKSYLD